MDRAIDCGRIALSTEIEAIAASGRVEVIIDATGHPNSGAEVAQAAIRNGKHVVMLNVEADITIGRQLKADAKRAGVVYSGAAGDEPAARLARAGSAARA